MTDQVELQLYGQPTILSAHRAAFLIEHSLLLLSDLHLGKSHIFRRAGIAIPEGASGEDLKRLAQLIERYQPAEVCILGDVVHGAELDEPSRAAWLNLLSVYPHVKFQVVAGNHDRHLSGMGLNVPISWTSVRRGALLLTHAPEDVLGTGVQLNICGHTHPVVHVPGEGRRFPSFWLSPHRLVMPAFSAFTGGWKIERAVGTRAWATHAGEIVQVL